jgi:hypothetical protein
MAIVYFIEIALPDPDLTIVIRTMAYLYLAYVFSVSDGIPNETNEPDVIFTHLLVPQYDFQLLIQISLLHIDRF